jgi:thymidine kinase
VSTLQLSSKGEPFTEVKDMMPWATKIEICPAVCPVTGRDAFYTHRKFKEEREIIVGGADMYEPRCFEKYEYVNLKFEGSNE